MNPENEIDGEQKLEFDTFIKDSQRLNLEPFMDSDRRICGLHCIILSPFVVFYRLPENLEASGVA